MNEFIVKANGRYFFDNILAIGIALLIYVGGPILLINYYKKNHNQLMILFIGGFVLYIIATVCMFFGVAHVTQKIGFNEKGIVVQRVFKKASFSKDELTYDIDYFRSSQGVTQQSVFIKAGGKVYIFREKEVVNYPRAVEYLKKNCKKEKIYK